MLPLAFGMVTADKVAGVGAHLVDTILTKDAGHLDTGIFGTRYLVDALARIGRIDVARTILGQTTYPGFGYQIQRGATTPWEQWTYESNMETHDHATVPVNAEATVSVPVPRQDSKVTVTPGAVPLPGDATTRRYSVGSGNWQFSVDRCGQ